LRVSEHTGVEAIIDLPGYKENFIKSDIMYGGFNDINGELRFRPGVSLEILEMALARDYTLDDVDKVVALFEAYFEKVGQFYGEF
jgi:hypothetical protein